MNLGLAMPATIVVLTIVAWTCAVVLVRAAWGADIGALTERAIVAVGIAGFGTVYSLVVTNTELGQPVAHDFTVFAVRLCVIGLLLIPPVWLFLYARRRLGGNGDE